MNNTRNRAILKRISCSPSANTVSRLHGVAARALRPNLTWNDPPLSAVQRSGWNVALWVAPWQVVEVVQAVNVPPVVKSMAAAAAGEPPGVLEVHEAEATELLVEAQAAYTELQEVWLQLSHDDDAT